jgi:hypothetical protein
MVVGTVFTLFVVPVFYSLIAATHAPTGTRLTGARPAPTSVRARDEPADPPSVAPRTRRTPETRDAGDPRRSVAVRSVRG